MLEKQKAYFGYCVYICVAAKEWPRSILRLNTYLAISDLNSWNIPYFIVRIHPKYVGQQTSAKILRCERIKGIAWGRRKLLTILNVAVTVIKIRSDTSKRFEYASS